MTEQTFVNEEKCFHFLNLVIKCTCVFNLLLIRQWFGHIVVPTLRTARGVEHNYKQTKKTTL